MSSVSMPVTAHFYVGEFACRSGEAYPIDNIDDEVPGGRWWDTRLMPLCQTLEVIRAELGGKDMHIDSGYRTLAYDQMLYDRSAHDGTVATPRGSQHPKGKAADIVVVSLSPVAVHSATLMLFNAGKLPLLGGLGLYGSFCHVDIRRRVNNHLAQWSGKRASNIA